MRGFLCLIVAMAVPQLAYAHTGDQRETIEVTASASVDRQADQVRLTLAVETTAQTAEVASDRNAEKMSALIGALRAMGLKKSAIRTLAYRLTPQYDRGERGNRDPDPIGFMAQNMVEARIDSIRRVGSVIDRAIESGANRVNSLNFELREPEEAYLEALEKAVKRAKIQAEAIARAAGRRLGPPVRISTSGGRPAPRGVSVREFHAAATPIEAGPIQVNATVTVQYEIEGD